MEKFKYEITTRSSLIVSPRSNLAFYRELGEFVDAAKVDEKMKVIYPFYQYGEYEKYDPEHAEYYLPGSSIKGALCQEDSESKRFFDDISIPNNSIVLRNLHKAQYLENKEKACFGVFFENVGVEMVKAETTLKGEMYLKDDAEFKVLLTAANKSTKLKIGQMLAYLDMLIKKLKKSDDFIENIKVVIEKLKGLSEQDDIFLLGGFKGLLHSLELRGLPEDIKSAAFLDPATNLPHGLVTIKSI